jgi:hypothetical protein
MFVTNLLEIHLASGQIFEKFFYFAINHHERKNFRADSSPFCYTFPPH